MKKLLLILLICCTFFTANAADTDSLKSYYGDTILIPLSRKALKKIAIQREVDSLIVNRDFLFKPFSMHSRYKGLSGTVPSLTPSGDRVFLKIHNGWLESTLPHQYVDLAGKTVSGSFFDPSSSAHLRLLTYNFKIPKAVKEEDRLWFLTIEIELINEKQTYELVVNAVTSEAVLRVTSNRWGGQIIYSGWIVST